MSPGPILTLRIRGTGTLVKQSTWASMNTIGATHWTDGRIDGDMYAEDDWLLKHPTTNELFWIDECEELARFEYYTCDDDEADQRARERYDEVPWAKPAKEQDFLAALEDPNLVDTVEKERYLRTKLWWIANDVHRNEGGDAAAAQNSVSHAILDPSKSVAPASPDPAFFRENLKRLLDLLDRRKPAERLMSAEIAREIEEFALAKRLLRRKFPKDLTWMAEFIATLAEREDSKVCIFTRTLHILFCPLQYDCPKRWETLALTEVDDIRFCDACQRKVFRPKCVEDLVRLRCAGERVALLGGGDI